MKHIRFRAVALALLAYAAAATAQTSSVTVDGQISAGLTHRDHKTGGVSDNLMGPSQLTVSFLRFAGVEDMGGGMKALFRLEAGLGVNDGTVGGNGTGGSKFWNRQSYVGIDTGSSGVITLGRQFHASSDRSIRSFDVYQQAGSSVFVTPMALFGVNRFAANDNRVDGSIKYRLNVPGIVEFAASVGESNSTMGRSYGLDLAHTEASYSVGLLYVHYDAPSAIAGTSTLPEHKLVGVGGNVTLGDVRLYASWYDSALDSTVAGRPAQDNRIVNLGAAWRALPNTLLRAAYTDDKGTKLNGIAGRDGKKTTLVASAEYSLSKRTTLNATYANNHFSDGYKLDPVNIAALSRDPAASSVSLYSVGINHTF